MTRHLPSTHTFPIVGIGASAGGLQALLEFFGHCDPGMGMAFVIVMHFSPTHESNASALIRTSTSMPVVEVNQAVHIERDHVYVIAPNKQLEMVDGYLRVTDRPALQGWPTAIDTFFRTLAVAHQTRAVAIILSGLGSDGMLGLAGIREHGGVALVQSPQDAEFSGMPRAAIEAGHADFILPVADMPPKLRALWDNAREITLPGGGQAPDEADVSGPPGEEEALRDILATLCKRTGHDFTKYKRGTLLRRIERRLQVRQAQTLVRYSNLLREDRAESASLLRDLLIGVTQFFRDPAAFGVIEQEIIPALFANAANGDALRIWSAGCSTGEEAYSLGILFAEAAARSGQHHDFQIFGSDIDEHAITLARAGLYSDAIAADVSPERLAAHFHEENGGYRIRKAIRDKLLFANQNLLRDPPFSKLDLISCRNLLIYLNRETHAAVLGMFHYALRPGGFLFLGSADSADTVAEYFVPIDKNQRIYQARVAAHPARSAIPLATPALQAPAIQHADRERSGRPAVADVHQRLLADLAPPSILVDQESNIVHLSDGTGQFLRHVAGEPSRNVMALIEPQLRIVLRAALFNAIKSGKSVETSSTPFERGNRTYYVTIVVRPFYDAASATDYVLILFNKLDKPSDSVPVADTLLAPDALLSGLEQELQRTREQMQETIEQSESSNQELKAANEELQAINEELRFATEELESSKEELQSVNEELITVNFELKNKVEETSKVNDDLHNLIASTDLATIFVDRRMRIKRYTPQACNLFNLIPSDVGRPLHDITHKLHYPELDQDAGRTFDTLRPIEREVASNDGRCFIARLSPYRTGLDQIDGAVLTFIDISERRRAEERARAGEERMRLVADSTRDYAIITMDRDGLITSFNNGAERIFGYREEEMLGRPDVCIFTPEDRAAGVPEEEKRRARAEGRAEDERWHLRKDGSRFFCSGVMTPLRDGELTGYAKIGRDLTGRQEAERNRAEQLAREQDLYNQAQQDNAQKDQFLAVVSHELKHPLNLIHMHTEVLLRQPVVRATPPLQKAISAIRSSTISQAKIINDLMDLSRVVTGKMELNFSHIDLLALVTNIVEVIGASPAGPQVTLHVPFGTAIEVRGDEVRLEQVVWNLLSNAVKFTPPEGRVDITLDCDGSWVELQVRDTGQGIRQDVLPNIFEIFKQGSASSFRSKGLGIGLALVHQVVGLHGGRISAASDGPGQGACFTVALPLARPQNMGKDEALVAAEILRGKRILLVDDNQDGLDVFAMLLELEGAAVSASNSAIAALSLLDEQPFDMIVSDINMPDMDGFTFIRAVREHCKCADIPAVAISGLGRQQDIDAAMEAGFSGYLNKPVQMDQLVHLLETLLGSTATAAPETAARQNGAAHG